MNTVFLAQSISRFVRRNASTILTICGVVGVATSCALSAKAGANVARNIQNKEKEKGSELTSKEKVKIVAKEIVAPTVSAVATGLCVVGSNQISKKTEARLIGAYAVAAKSFTNYRKKVDEVYGDGSDELIQRELMKDNLVKVQNPPKNNGDIELFYLEIPGGDEFNSQNGIDQESRFFETTTENVQNAFYYLNRLFVLRGYVFLNDLYEELGIPKTSFGEIVGWDSYVGETEYGYQFIDYYIKEEIMEIDGAQPLSCKVIRMPFDPTGDCVAEYYI